MTTASLISIKAVTQRTSLSRATIDRMVRAGTFPKKRNISPRRRGFPSEEIDAWIAARSSDASQAES